MTWRSKKQNVVAISSAKAEFCVLARGICELVAKDHDGTSTTL